MKVFVQNKSESIIINDDITITVVDVLDEEVVLAVDAPPWIEVCEQEALEEPEMMRACP